MAEKTDIRWGEICSKSASYTNSNRESEVPDAAEKPAGPDPSSAPTYLRCNVCGAIKVFQLDELLEFTTTEWPHCCEEVMTLVEQTALSPVQPNHPKK
jgi:hypothetical protein